MLFRLNMFKLVLFFYLFDIVIIFFHTQASWIRLRSCWAFGVLCKSLGMRCTQSRHKVPFIYYVITCIALNLIWQPNFSPKLRFFLSKQKEFLFWHYILTKFSWWSLKFLVHKKEEKCSKNLWKCCGWEESAYVIYEWSL